MPGTTCAGSRMYAFPIILLAELESVASVAGVWSILQTVEASHLDTKLCGFATTISFFVFCGGIEAYVLDP